MLVPVPEQTLPEAAATVLLVSAVLETIEPVFPEVKVLEQRDEFCIEDTVIVVVPALFKAAVGNVPVPDAITNVAVEFVRLFDPEKLYVTV